MNLGFENQPISKAKQRVGCSWWSQPPLYSNSCREINSRTPSLKFKPASHGVRSTPASYAVSPLSKRLKRSPQPMSQRHPRLHLRRRAWQSPRRRLRAHASRPRSTSAMPQPYCVLLPVRQQAAPPTRALAAAHWYRRLGEDWGDLRSGDHVPIARPVSTAKDKLAQGYREGTHHLRFLDESGGVGCI